MRADRASILTALLVPAFLAGCEAGRVPMPQAGSDGPVQLDPRMALERSPLDEAVAMVLQDRYQEASQRLATLVPRYERHGQPKLAAEAIFWLGFCREKQARAPEAVALYERVLTDYPDQPAAEEAKTRREWLLPKRRAEDSGNPQGIQR